MIWNPLKPYANVRWRKESKHFLLNNPFCNHCLESGRDVPASIVDHIQPHKGDYTLFWDQSNWQGLCASCHSGFKRRLETSGKVIGCDVDGIPLDKRSHWR